MPSRGYKKLNEPNNDDYRGGRHSPNGDIGALDLTPEDDNMEFYTSTHLEPDVDPTAHTPLNSTVQPPAAAASASASASSPAIPISPFAFFSLDFYKQFFRVDTSMVLRRCAATVYPPKGFMGVVEDNPDLYGPFWITTTLVMILFLTGSLSRYASRNGTGADVRYDFTLLSGAAGLMYGYTIFVPAGLWGALRWFGSKDASLLDCWCLYGYANLIWIPVAIISWSPYSILNYVFVGLGLAVSLYFLLLNLYPVLMASELRRTRMIFIAVIAVHAGLAIAIKVLFFAHKSPLSKGKGD